MGALLLAPVISGSTAKAQANTATVRENGMVLKNGVVLTGIVAGEPTGGAMIVRARNGITYRVQPHSGVNLDDISGGDSVRVFGNLMGQVLSGASVRVLVRRASSSPSDYSGNYMGDARPGTSQAINTARNERLLTHRNLTLDGTVVGELDGGDFLLRAYDYTYHVQVPANRPLHVRVGDRVRAYGNYSSYDGVLYASNTRVLSRAVLNAPARRNVTGAVYQNLAGEEFRVSSYNGSLYRVLALHGEPKLNIGDMVRASGVVRNGVLQATSVDVLRRYVSGLENSSYQPRRTVVGNVVADLRGNHFQIRAANGQTYPVIAIWGQSQPLQAGDYVRAYGYWQNGALHASNLRVLQNNE